MKHRLANDSSTGPGNGRWRLAVLLVALFVFTSPPVSAAEAVAGDPVDFNFHIRPLLSDRCFKCHGPDEKSRKGKLRLDIREGALKTLDDGSQVVSPGHPEKSEFFHRITTQDEDDVMPPKDSNLTLNPEEIELLRRWIAQGAEYKPHWSFIPVGKVEIPQATAGTSARNPIDLFINARLAREGLKSSPEAARETLIRRVSLDLTGVPPTIAEIDAFLADTSADAYEKMVARYLDSPAYGERMANEWMDLARFADTYGYQADVTVDMSPWRDWVIKAFNENLPYDQFALWQVAGDLLPNPTREQILATAFNRLHRQTNEGGSVEEEFRVEYVSDRLHTFGTAFLSLTFECSRCHDHKYDPISQKDYYSLSAFFNNIDESGLYSHFTRATPSPTLLLYQGDAEVKHHAARQKIADEEARFQSIVKEARGRFESWRSSFDPAHATFPQPTAKYSFETIISNRVENAMGTNLAELGESPELVDGKIGKALKFNGDNWVVGKGVGVFQRTDPFSFSLWLNPAEIQPRSVIFHRSRAWTDSASRGYELLLENGHPSFAIIHFWPGNAIGVRAKSGLPTNEWTHLTITYDGSSRAEGITIYRNGQPVELEVVRNHLYKDITHRQEWGDADVGGIHLTLAARFRDSGFRNGTIDEFQVFDRCLTPFEAKRLAGKTDAVPTPQELFALYLRDYDEPVKSAWNDLARARVEENNLVNDVREIMVMQEMEQRRPTFLLQRGAYDAPGDKVEANTPDLIMPMPSEYPRNRLGLARWLIDPRNPLTARVAVNRAWKLHFGRGLVATLEDFGSQGQLPTHPELLDWLAKSFMDSGWNKKELHRLILISATYRQASEGDAELIAKDPENHLLARGPKHRLLAEQIRDSALAVSGLLSKKIGGPSVKPYQPAGLWEESGTGQTYVQDKGESLYRRSLYLFWRRTLPPPTMISFDATSREVCTAKREVTSTPLQALVLLNDPQFVEAARVLAEKLVRDCQGDLDNCITQAFRTVTGRAPQPKERAILRRLYEEQLAYFTATPEAAEKYRSTGEYPVDKSLDAPQVAATTVLASALMNYDEFVMKR